MGMVVNVVGTVAVVAVAFGAVAELHTGIILIGDAADGTLMEIAPPLAQLLLCLLEVDGLGGVLVYGSGLPAVQHLHQIIPKENQVVKDGNYGQERHGKLSIGQIKHNFIEE